VNQVTPASLRYPLSVFNKNSTLSKQHTRDGTAISPISGQQNKVTHTLNRKTSEIQVITGLNLLHRAKFERFRIGKSDFLN